MGFYFESPNLKYFCNLQFYNQKKWILNLANAYADLIAVDTLVVKQMG